MRYDWKILQVCQPWTETRSEGAAMWLHDLQACHAMLSCFSRVQLFVTLKGYSLPGSSDHGILQARILKWVAMPSSRGSSWPRDQTHVSCDSWIVDRFFTAEPPGKPSLQAYKGSNVMKCMNSKPWWQSFSSAETISQNNLWDILLHL